MQSAIAGPPDRSGVEVEVRLLSGRGSATPAKEQAVPANIQDLKAKLGKLHYQNYELLGEMREVIPLTERREIKLSKGNHLILRPMYVEGRKVGMWIRWDDDHRRQVLNTMMHFHCGESLVTGAESKEGRGTILALRVSPVSLPPSPLNSSKD